MIKWVIFNLTWILKKVNDSLIIFLICYRKFFLCNSYNGTRKNIGCSQRKKYLDSGPIRLFSFNSNH